MAAKFDKNNFKKRLSTMLGVDFRRMFTSSLFYLMVGISLVIPILILLMVTMMDGSVSVNPQTDEETIMEGFKTVWEIIGTSSSATTDASAGMSMSITSMCNINMMFFAIAVFVCIFVGDDFRSGYAKNLFTVRSNKSDYVISKTIASFVAGAVMIVMFFIGAMIGSKFAGLSFALDGANAFNVLMCILSKIFIVGIFSSIYVLACVFAKQKLWLSLLLSLGIGMLFFMMIPIISPLNSTFLNVLLSFVGSVLFSFGIGFASKKVLEKTSLV